MTFCTIKTCPNSQKVQFEKQTRSKMCYFPLKDAERCLKWIEYVKLKTNVENWTPNENSALCEVL